jgi:hypothetical protein
MDCKRVPINRMPCELAARMSELYSSDKLGYFRPTGTEAACQRLRIVDTLATASDIATPDCLIDDLRVRRYGLASWSSK